MIKRPVFLLFAILLAMNSWGQTHISDHSSDAHFKKGLELLDKKKYSAARQSFENYTKENPGGLKSSDAQYLIAYCALMLHNKDGEHRIESFVVENPAHPKAQIAYYEVATYFFKEKNYNKAIHYLEKINTSLLNMNQRNEAQFMLGYAHFAKQNFPQSLQAFNTLKTSGNRYRPMACYYSGYIHLRNGNYDKALADLLQAENSESYASVVPLMIATAYYKQKRYDEVIQYGEATIEKRSTKTDDDFLLLLADAHYHKQNLAKASQYYDQYKEKRKSVTDPEILYRAGYAHFKTGNKGKAIENFKTVALKDDTLSQVASYYLGSLYIQEDNKIFALTAYDKARKQRFNPSIQEQSAFNFAKLNLELGKINDAINALNDFSEQYPKSTHQQEAEELLSNAYLSSNDYNQAIKHIEGLNTKSGKIKSIYQKVTFYKGTEYFNSGQYFNAVQMFQKSLKYPMDEEYVMLANFWAGEAYSIGKKYHEAINAYAAVFRVNGSENHQLNLKTRYGIGYAYYNTQQYDKALVHFKEYVNRLERASQKLFYNDALIRLADCYYVNKGYHSSISYYDKAIKENNPDKDYAYFQKGMILGILNKPEEAKSSFDIVISQFPKSRYVEEAIYYKAQQDFERGNYQAAVAGFSSLIKKGAGNVFASQAYLKRALSNYNLKNYESTIQDYKTILDEYATSKVANSALMGLQEVLAIKGQSSDFDGYLKKFKNANPDSEALESIEFESAKTLYFNEKYDQALKSLKVYLKAYPSSAYLPEAKFYIAESHYRLNEDQQALGYYYEIARDNKSPYLIRVLHRSGELEYENKKYNEAIAYYHKLANVARNKKEQYNAWSGLMESYFMVQKYDSVNFYAKLILEKGNVSVNAQNKAQLFLGKAAYEQKNYDKAVDEFILTLNSAKDEHGAEAQYLMAHILYQKKQYKHSIEALHNLNASFAIYELWLGKSFLLIADNYVAMDEIFQAKATLNSVIEKSPLKDIVNEANVKLKAVQAIENKKVQSEDFEENPEFEFSQEPNED